MPISGRLLLALLVLAAAGAPARAAEAERPDLVMVVLDTLRPDHLGLYGYPHETAPFLAELAARGVVFERAWSTSSWTAPSTASLFTSLHPTQHGVIEGFMAHQGRVEEVETKGRATVSLNRMPATVRTLPELLRAGGYRTFGVAANLNIGPEMGFTRGFDRFERLDHRPRTAGPGVVSAPAEDVLDTLRGWEGEIRSASPLFLYLHLNDPHAPYHAREEFLRAAPAGMERRKALYDSEIGYADAVLRRTFEHLGLGEDTWTIVVSDHGEAFGEHGRVNHEWGLYGEIHRIAFLVVGPPGGVDPWTTAVPVSILDALPTTLELAGLAPPEDREGVSLVPLLRSGPARLELVRKLARRTLFAHRARLLPTPRHAWAAVRGRWKLIDEEGYVELYDTRSDPGETRDLAGERPDLVRELQGALRRFRAGAELPSERVETTMDPAMLEALRALGYVHEDEGEEEAP